MFACISPIQLKMRMIHMCHPHPIKDEDDTHDAQHTNIWLGRKEH